MGTEDWEVQVIQVRQSTRIYCMFNMFLGIL